MKNENDIQVSVKLQEYEKFLSSILRELEDYLKLMLSTIELYKKSRRLK